MGESLTACKVKLSCQCFLLVAERSIYDTYFCTSIDEEAEAVGAVNDIK